MRLLISGATKTLARYASAHEDVLGILVIPRSQHRPVMLADFNLPLAADNGAFSGFKPPAFEAMLARFALDRIHLGWVACPDVVADAAATWDLWSIWEPIIRKAGFRPSMVLQDGMDLDGVRGRDPSAVFIGGTTEFKLGPEARRIAEWAVSLGRPVHMGRVNTERRIRYAVSIGCTSCDGSGFSKWPDIRIPMGIRWIEKAMAG